MPYPLTPYPFPLAGKGRALAGGARPRPYAALARPLMRPVKVLRRRVRTKKGNPIQIIAKGLGSIGTEPLSPALMSGVMLSMVRGAEMFPKNLLIHLIIPFAFVPKFIHSRLSLTQFIRVDKAH